MQNALFPLGVVCQLCRLVIKSPDFHNLFVVSFAIVPANAGKSMICTSISGSTSQIKRRICYYSIFSTDF